MIIGAERALLSAGADIVFDLTKEIPKQYENSADLVYDGSVMDNVFKSLLLRRGRSVAGLLSIILG